MSHPPEFFICDNTFLYNIPACYPIKPGWRTTTPSDSLMSFAGDIFNSEKGDMDKRNALTEGSGTIDGEQILAVYDFTTDGLTCFYRKELMEIFPDISVVMNKRDPGRTHLVT